MISMAEFSLHALRSGSKRNVKLAENKKAKKHVHVDHERGFKLVLLINT